MPLRTNIVRRSLRWGWAVALLLSLCGVSGWAQASSEATTVTPTEARILIYVCPAAAAERQKGYDIAMEQQTSMKLDQMNYYYFWVYNATRQQSSGSVTVGYYAVNKHTGQVWNIDDNNEATSRLLKGVQAIIRKSHHIDKATIEEYSSARL